MYRMFFKTTFYCSPPPDNQIQSQIESFATDGWNMTFIHPNSSDAMVGHQLGWAQLNYLCLEAVQNWYTKKNSAIQATGYLFMGHDVLFQPRVCKLWFRQSPFSKLTLTLYSTCSEKEALIYETIKKSSAWKTCLWCICQPKPKMWTMGTL